MSRRGRFLVAGKRIDCVETYQLFDDEFMSRIGAAYSVIICSYRTLPGFMMPLGSNVALMLRMTSKATGDL